MFKKGNNFDRVKQRFSLRGNNFDRVKQRFSLRKLNIGVCSVLLGLTFMSGNNTVKADTTKNPTKLEESKATDQSQTGPTHPQKVVVDASAAVKNNTNDAESSNATNHINSGNSDNGGSDLSEVGLKGIKQNNNGTETVNTAKIADQIYANTYGASLLEVDANPNSSHDSSDNNTETNSRSTIIGLNEYSNPKHLGEVTEKLSDTARSIKQVNITPDELKPTLLDETGKAVENTSKVLNFDLSVYVHDSVSGVNNLDLDWQIDDRLSNQIDSISIDEGKDKTPVTFKKDTNSNVWRADFNKAAQMTWVSGGILNGHVQKTGTITFKDSIFNVLKQADILNKNNEVDTNKDPLVYRSYVSYEGEKTETGHVWGIGTQFVSDVYEPHSIIATTFNTSYFNTDKDNQIMAAEKNYGVSTADLNKDGTHSFVGGYDDVYYDSTNNTIVVDNYLNRWDNNANDKVKYWTYHYGVDPKLLPYIKSGEISRINFGGVIDSGASYKSQVRALPDATNDNDSTYNYHNQLLLDQNGDGAFSGQEGTQYQEYASEHPSIWNNHGKVSSNLGNYYYGILNSRPLVIRTIYHLNDKLSDGSKMSLTSLLREIGKTTTTPQLLFTNFMTDTDGKVVKGTESVSAPTFDQLSTPIAGPDQFTQTVNYVDGKDQTIGSQNYVGEKNTTQDFTGQVPQGWVLDGDTLPKAITIGTTNGSQNIKVKIDPQLVNDLQNNLKNANALNANTDTPKVADGALTQAITDGNNASKLLYGKDAPTNMQNTINELANTNDLVQALINGKNAESTAKYYNDTDDNQKALTDAMTAGTNAISSGITAQDQFEGAASAIETAINGLKGQPTSLDNLNQAISQGTSAQAGSKYANSSDTSKAALDQAINAGQTAKTQSGLTQKEADADASAIEQAINGLSGKETDKTALTAAISKGEAAKKSASYYNDTNGDDKSALDNALSQAGEDLKNNALTQAAAAQDAQAIETAINGLKGQPTNLDKLNQAISQGTSAQAGSKYANSSDDSKAALDQAINAGQTAKTQSGLTQKEADADASAIEQAINGLSGKETDKTALTAAISKGEAAKKSASYYNDTNGDDKSALDNALSQAGEDLKNNALTQAAAAQDAQAIETAINGLKGQPTNLDKLNQAISQGTSAQAGSKYANSSDDSKAALDQAINAGQTAKTQSGLTQKEADADASAIEQAINGLSGKETDKTALTAAISKGEAAKKSASYYNDTNGDDKSALDNALSQAGEDLKNNALTQAAAAQDAQAIETAINGLKGQPTNLDKLNQAISQGTSAQAGSKYANSSDDSKAALDQAINAGQTAKTQSGLTQKEADADASAIEQAINGLSGKETDKTALTDAISKGEAAKKSASYYNDTNGDDKSALDNALSQAGEDLKNNALTQAAADQDAQAIETAINGLKGQPTNLDKLNQAISQGTSAQAGSKYANSSDDSKAALDQAINAGQTAKTQSGLTQKEADADASAIEQAINGLSGKETDKTALTDAISKGEAAKKSASYYNDTNGDDKSALDNALSQAGEDLKNNALTQAAAAQDAQAIETAINGLKGQPTNLDKLNQAISQGTSAQAGSKYANSSDDSKAALDQAINAGQTAKTQSGLTQKEADADASAIEQAINGLSGKETDKTALTAAISKGEAAKKSASYYNDTNGDDKSALDNALSQAGEDLKNNALTQAAADQDAQAIETAINGLKGQPTNLDKLNQAISQGTSAQAGSKYANSSDDSKAALDQAINAGQTAKTQSGLTQKEADADASAIEQAINGLSGKETDKTALTDAISKGEAAKKSASYYNDTNGDDKSALDNALSQAGEDLKNNALTQAAAAQDAQAIETAINGLKGQPTNLDKLNQAISQGTSAQAGSKYANSSDDSKAALDQAINAGQTAKTQSGLTQKEADADASAIEQAINGLSGKETDKTALTDAISKGEAAKKSASYYNDTNGDDKSALDNALSQAGEDLKNNALTQAAAAQDAQAIETAINGLKGQPTNLDKLNQAISQGTSAQAGSKYANSSDDSKAALDQAINAGQTAKTQSGLTQKEADADASAIEQAINGLSGKETDKTALTAAISKGEAAKKSASYYNDTNGDDKSALDNALSQAGEDLKNNALTQAAADQDAQAIETAINGLKGQPTNLDKLNQAISQGTSAQAGSKYANSSDDSKAALDQAINAGQTAKTQSGLTQKEADADASAIEQAINGLSGKETDKTALTDAISKGEAAKKSASYYNDTNGDDKSALDNALSQAGEDLKNNALTQAAAAQDAQAIETAINGLKGQPTNLDKLNQAISQGTSAQAGSKYANSSDDSKAALDQAINAGQTAKTQSGLTQKEADADASAIEQAINGLSGKETDKTALTDAISKGEAAKKSASYYNDTNGDDKSALDNALSQAGEDLKNNALTQAAAAQDAQAIETAINGLKGQPTNLDKLNQAISDGTSAQAGSKYANSSDESKGALDQAIKAGQTAKTQSGLTQKEADADASAIETAIKGLSGKETDKTALTDAISKGEAAQKSASYYNDANGDDKSALDKALSQAGEDLKNNTLTQATADQDAKAIQDAINGLKGQPTNLDKLNQAISDGTSAQAGSKYANSSDESKGALDQAIKAGQTAKTQSGLTQKEADADASAIETAIKGLSGKETDKTALTDAISKGEAAQKSASYYNDANGDDKSALDKALSQAGEDLKNNDLTQATADQDAKAIQDAINGLKGQPTNLDKLNQAISDGTSAQAGSKYANSSDESKGALDQAIKAGQTAKTQSGLTQKEADADASAIETAIKGLSGKETDKTALTDAISKGHKTQTGSSDYQDTSDAKRSQLDKDITDAETLNQDPKASQSNVDAAAKKISDDINNLNQGTDAANNKPAIPASKIPVGDHSHLTDDEKDQVQKNIAANNTNLPQGSKINVDDQGNTTITYPDGSKNTISGKDTTQDVSKSDLDKAINLGNDTKNSDNYANTSNQNRDDLDKAIKHGQGVANDPHASQKDIDDATKQITDAESKVNNGQTDASKNKPVIPSTKTPVSDNSHLTDDEKDQVKDNVQKNNPAGKVTNVDDNGNATITYPDGSKNVISGKNTTTGTSKDDLNKAINNGNSAKTSGNYDNTSDQNRDDLNKAIDHGNQVKNDPHASQKDIDNATKAINKAIDNVNNGQTDASKNKPVIPTTKTPVSDNSHLTDDEKSQVKDNVQKSNSNGKVTNVDDQGNTTIEPAKMVSVKEAAPAEMTAQKAAQAQDQLPQTGEDNSKAAFGLGLASILGGIGILGAFKRKKKEN
ncbi:YSIRK-type signal peptide-containing protein [Ligilactobacillus equi]